MVIVKQWARTVVAATLMAGIIDMVLPAGDTRRLVRLVTGTIVLLTIAAPLVTVITREIPPMYSLNLSATTRTGDDARDALVAQLAAQVRGLLERSPEVAVATVCVNLEPGDSLAVQSVTAAIVREGSTPVWTGQRITVTLGQTQSADGPDALAEELKTAISLLTGLDPDRVAVTMSDSWKE